MCVCVQWTWECRYPFEIISSSTLDNTWKWNCWIVRYFLFLNFLRKLHNIFHIICINILPHKQCTRVLLFPPHPYQNVSFSLIIAILTGMRWYVLVILICDSLIINDVEHLFIYMLANSMSWENVYSGLLHNFLIGLFSILLLSCMNSLYILDINPLSRYMICKYFLPSCKLPFLFFCFLCCAFEIFSSLASLKSYQEYIFLLYWITIKHKTSYCRKKFMRGGERYQLGWHDLTSERAVRIWKRQRKALFPIFFLDVHESFIYSTTI